MSARRPKRKPARAPAGAGRRHVPKQPPWRSARSLLAGLPRTRDAWVALVVAVMRDHPTHAATARALEMPTHTVETWWSWLLAERDEGRLAVELPDRSHWARRLPRVAEAPLRAAGHRSETP